MIVVTSTFTWLFHHSRESGNPGLRADRDALDPRFRGGDDKALKLAASSWVRC
jgi:hypothetical protein